MMRIQKCVQEELDFNLPLSKREAVLGELRRMDEERVAGALQVAVMDPTNITPETISALFEALSYHTLLDDAEVSKHITSLVTGLLCTLPTTSV